MKMLFKFLSNSCIYHILAENKSLLQKSCIYHILAEIKSESCQNVTFVIFWMGINKILAKKPHLSYFGRE